MKTVPVIVGSPGHEKSFVVIQRDNNQVAATLQDEPSATGFETSIELGNYDDITKQSVMDAIVEKLTDYVLRPDRGQSI